MKECIVNLPQGKLKGTDFEAYRQFFDVPYAADSGKREMLRHGAA